MPTLHELKPSLITSPLLPPSGWHPLLPLFQTWSDAILKQEIGLLKLFYCFIFSKKKIFDNSVLFLSVSQKKPPCSLCLQCFPSTVLANGYCLIDCLFNLEDILREDTKSWLQSHGTYRTTRGSGMGLGEADTVQPTCSPLMTIWPT